MKPAAPARLMGRVIHALGEVESTQSEAARLAALGALEGTVVTAEHQTGGRGRRGRRWTDAPGESVLASVILRPLIRAALAPQLSLVAAIAVVDGLEAATALVAGIRWPNDIWVGGRKLGGILLDAASLADGRLQHVILGIGINVNQDCFGDDLRERATSLRIVLEASQNGATVLERVLDALDRRYAEFLAGGLRAVRVAWLERAATIGQRVRTADGAVGVAVDVDEEGALVIRADDGRMVRILAGEAADAPGH